MGAIGTAKKFPFQTYTLFCGEMFGVYYGVKRSVNYIKHFTDLTPRFQTQKELEEYLKGQGYKIRFCKN